MNPIGREAVSRSLGELAASSTSTIAFGGIAVVVTGVVFGGPYLETRRRAASVRTALRPLEPAAPETGYDRLRDAEQWRAYRIAALMTGDPERATATVEEAFARTLQQWTRLPADARVWFVLSTTVKLCIGRAFVRSLGRPVGAVSPVETDDLVRAAKVFSVLEPTRRAIAILSRAERLEPDEVARVMGIDAARVQAELDAALVELGPALGAVAA
jgi:DNA-directed RNA polymerase specialized sigma24 family protein